MTKTLYSVIWSPSAEADLNSIIDYILLENVYGAKTVFEAISHHCIKLEQFPMSGRVPLELKIHNIGMYREIVVMNWRVLYKIIYKEVHVLAVIDTRREIDDTLLDRLINRK